MHMARKVDLLDVSYNPEQPCVDIPYSPVIINAARNVMDCLSKILAVYPRVETMMVIFGAYRCYLAFSVVAINILNAPYPLEYAADIKLLENLTQQAAVLSRGQRDIGPLTLAMQSVIAEIKARVDEYSVD